MKIQDRLFLFQHPSRKLRKLVFKIIIVGNLRFSNQFRAAGIFGRCILFLKAEEKAILIHEIFRGDASCAVSRISAMDVDCQLRRKGVLCGIRHHIRAVQSLFNGKDLQSLSMKQLLEPIGAFACLLYEIKLLQLEDDFLARGKDKFGYDGTHDNVIHVHLGKRIDLFGGEKSSAGYGALIEIERDSVARHDQI